MKTEVESLKDYNKIFQKALANAEQPHNNDNNKGKERLSELLISDQLIHEENDKLIKDLKESGQGKQQEITRLTKALKESK